MRRVVQLAVNASLASSRSNNIIHSSSSIGLVASRRPISISSAYARQHDNPSSSSSSSGGKKKKGLWEIASDTIASVKGKPNNKPKTSNSVKPRSPKSVKPRSPQSTPAGQKSRDSLNGGGSNKMVETRSGYDARQQQQQKATMSREKSPLSSQTSKSGQSGGERPYNGPKDHRSLGSVKHDRDAHRFILDLGNNQVARIDYKPLGKDRIELYHTEVPMELRGHGIGKTLARGALESAAKENYKLKVTCDYLGDYVKRFADDKYKKLIEH